MGAAPGPAGAGSLQKDSKVAVAQAQAVRAARRQVSPGKRVVFLGKQGFGGKIERRPAEPSSLAAGGGSRCTPDPLGPRPSLAKGAEGRVRFDLTDDFLVLTGFDCKFYLSLHIPSPLMEAKVWKFPSTESSRLNLPPTCFFLFVSII